MNWTGQEITLTLLIFLFLGQTFAALEGSVGSIGLRMVAANIDYMKL